ncbi:MAG: hypothetical protein P8126_03550 [Gammaproteobacteria bacterium]|jgi:hypothetical protein
MKTISVVLRSFAAGAFGGAVNVLALIIIWHWFIPGPPLTADVLKPLLYKQMVWGGIWGFAFLIPIMSRNWALRGVVWGVAATAVALWGFKVVPVTTTNIIIGLIVNSGAWGLVASWLYAKSGVTAEPAPAAASQPAS